MAALALAGCVSGFEGANVQLDLSPATPVQANALATPAMGELPAATHCLFAPDTAVGIAIDCANVPAGVYSSRNTAVDALVNPALPSPTR